MPTAKLKPLLLLSRESGGSSLGSMPGEGRGGGAVAGRLPVQGTCPAHCDDFGCGQP
jgi:hypothetical protein